MKTPCTRAALYLSTLKPELSQPCSRFCNLPSGVEGARNEATRLRPGPASQRLKALARVWVAGSGSRISVQGRRGSAMHPKSLCKEVQHIPNDGSIPSAVAAQLLLQLLHEIVQYHLSWTVVGSSLLYVSYTSRFR